MSSSTTRRETFLSFMNPSFWGKNTKKIRIRPFWGILSGSFPLCRPSCRHVGLGAAAEFTSPCNPPRIYPTAFSLPPSPNFIFPNFIFPNFIFPNFIFPNFFSFGSLGSVLPVLPALPALPALSRPYILRYHPPQRGKFKFFSKKDAEIFAGSEKVATFASAFEKYRFFQIRRGLTIRESEVV